MNCTIFPNRIHSAVDRSDIESQKTYRLAMSLYGNKIKDRFTLYHESKNDQYKVYSERIGDSPLLPTSNQ